MKRMDDGATPFESHPLADRRTLCPTQPRASLPAIFSRILWRQDSRRDLRLRFSGFAETGSGWQVSLVSRKARKGAKLAKKTPDGLARVARDDRSLKKP